MTTDRRSQWLRGVLDLCLLAELQRGDSYGYQLAKALKERGLGDIPGGTLYPVLARLERSELVRTRWDQSDSGPPRKVYELTSAGRDLLDRERRDWGAFALAVDGLLAPEAAR